MPLKKQETAGSPKPTFRGDAVGLEDADSLIKKGLLFLLYV